MISKKIDNKPKSKINHKDILLAILKKNLIENNLTWHCIVERNFGSYVTHETKHFII